MHETPRLWGQTAEALQRTPVPRLTILSYLGQVNEAMDVNEAHICFPFF